MTASGETPPDAEVDVDASAPEDSPVAEADAAEAADPPVTVEDLVALVERLTAERNESLEARQRLQAEFENYRKRVAKQDQERTERAAEGLVAKLLATLDACDSALVHGAEAVEPIYQVLRSTLEGEGLERIDPSGEPFDPEVHEAVLQEDGDGGTAVVVDVLRPGYRWKGRVLRAAMVKVRT